MAAPIKFGVGQSVLRKEDDALIRGRGRYVADIAPPGDLPGEDHHAGHFETSRRVIAIPTKVLGLLIAGRHSTHRRLPGVGTRRGRRVPRPLRRR